MRLHLIRHAESENNAKPVYERVCDPGITRVGQLQADHLATWMKSLAIDELITSPFLRTLQTTAAVTRARSMSVQVWHDVFENGGCYNGHCDQSISGAAGLGRNQIAGKLGLPTPHQVIVDKEIGEHGWWGGRDQETATQSQQRAIQVASRLERTFPDHERVVAMIIHADFLRELLGVLLQDILNVERIGPIHNVSVTQLDRVDGHWRLNWLNSVTHLPARLVTGNVH